MAKAKKTVKKKSEPSGGKESPKPMVLRTRASKASKSRRSRSRSRRSKTSGIKIVRKKR